MIITIPQGYHFDKVKLNIGAGTLTGTGITAGESTLSVGAGQVTMKDFISYASKITCGMGEIVVPVSYTHLIETGDGQVSGLSPNQYVFKFYDEIRWRMCGNE